MAVRPYPEFPLSWHPQGYWCKKIKEKLHYFGTRHGSWQEALEEFKNVVDDLQLGRPRYQSGCTVSDLCNRFLHAKARAAENGELTERTWKDYEVASRHIVNHFGQSALVEKLTPLDFEAFRAELARGRSITTLANLVRIARIVFRFAETEEMIEGRVRFGSHFSEPSARAKKKHRIQVRAEHGLRMFEPWEIRRLMYAANPIMRAMISLGINCGYGNTDIARMPVRFAGLDVLEYPRPKTAEDRVNPLWPETVQLLKQALDLRPQPRDPDARGLLFLTSNGRPWVRATKKITNDEISKAFSKLLTSCGLKRHGLSFYGLRHTFLTIGEEVTDTPALSLMMGHADRSMASFYRERIDINRLQRISDHIMLWLGNPDIS